MLVWMLGCTSQISTRQTSSVTTATPSPSGAAPRDFRDILLADAAVVAETTGREAGLYGLRPSHRYFRAFFPEVCPATSAVGGAVVAVSVGLVARAGSAWCVGHAIGRALSVKYSIPLHLRAHRPGRELGGPEEVDVGSRRMDGQAARVPRLGRRLILCAVGRDSSGVGQHGGRAGRSARCALHPLLPGSRGKLASFDAPCDHPLQCVLLCLSI